MQQNLDQKYGIIINHKASGFNLDDVAKELQVDKKNIIKAILLEYKNQEPILCIIRSIDKLLTKNLKLLTGFKYSFMKEESLNKLNLSPGSIPPFIGFQLGIRIFVDKKLDDDYYYGSGGSVFNACKFLVKNYISLGAMIKNLTDSNL